MRIAVLGGAGAMGSVFGGLLARSGQDVTLIDVWEEAVKAINAKGLRLEDSSGKEESIPVSATTAPSEVGGADLVLTFVKSHQTDAAVRAAAPLIGNHTIVLTLQNGWGNGPRIGGIVGEDRVLVGVTYNSATVRGPGHVQHSGRGPSYIGELGGTISERATRIAAAFTAAGLETTATASVLKEIWSKLALNVCTLPTSALLGVRAGQLLEHEGLLSLMRALLAEVVAVAARRGIALDYDERWKTITGLLRRAAGAKASMLQDVERRRRTEIEVINGAVVAAGRELDIPTPYNDSMVWLIESLQETF